ncbi:SIMPL domain-containing protein [Agromyces larvae]|uniref:SIMPL domain-containing protein n=1 Tax=Agromyces larvae TaxID=2929802 RepID=A0ABY4C3F6_9MICO|nr:SIMPL domain-containing protein [Agromyces larvae]UOE45524.1 SIMPL domain-containing protein [Agromyces larvae]
MPDPVVITVLGSAETHHPAERATVTVSISFEAADRGRSFEPVSRLHSELGEQLRTLAALDPAPLTWWSAGQLRTASYRPWNKDGKVLPPVHRTTAEIEAKFADFATLADWTSRVALVDGVTVVGIDWALTERTRDRLRERVRDDAVRSARRKAEAYAASLGLGAVVPVAIADPGMLEAGMQSYAGGAPAGVRAMAAAGGGNGGPSIDFTPRHLTIEASVHARFEALPEH